MRRLHTLLCHEEAAEANVVLWNIVVQEDSDGHDGRRPSGHCSVQHEELVILDVLWQPQVVQLCEAVVMTG